MFLIKINDIQKQRLLTIEYENVILQATPDEKPQTTPSKHHLTDKKNDTTLINSGGNTYEIVVISNDFEDEKVIAADNAFEEYELLEVDNVDEIANAESLESQGGQQTIKQSQSDEITLIDLHDIEETKKPYQINTRQKQRSKTVEKQNTLDTKAHGMAKLQLSELAASGRRRRRQHANLLTQKATQHEQNEEHCEIELMQQDCDDMAEGKSDNEFPARDSDNEDWPSSNTMGEFPTEIMRDGLLLIKGKELMSIICR